MENKEVETSYRVSLAEYLDSAVDSKKKPAFMDEIAFVGRSNVGKSSLINRLVQRKNLARVSGSPGKTQTINYYRIGIKEIENSEVGKEFLLVDLPGYGYAKVSKKDRERWGGFVVDYLVNSFNLRQVFLLIDIRHDPIDSDIEYSRFLTRSQIPFSIVATKSDKISKNQVTKQIEKFRTVFELPKEKIIATSAEKGLGKEELLRKIAHWIAI